MDNYLSSPKSLLCLADPPQIFPLRCPQLSPPAKRSAASSGVPAENIVPPRLLSALLLSSSQSSLSHLHPCPSARGPSNCETKARSSVFRSCPNRPAAHLGHTGAVILLTALTRSLLKHLVKREGGPAERPNRHWLGSPPSTRCCSFCSDIAARRKRAACKHQGLQIK